MFSKESMDFFFHQSRALVLLQELKQLFIFSCYFSYMPITFISNSFQLKADHILWRGVFCFWSNKTKAPQTTVSHSLTGVWCQKETQDMICFVSKLAHLQTLRFCTHWLCLKIFYQHFLYKSTQSDKTNNTTSTEAAEAAFPVPRTRNI